jgi:hypothetical protein
MLEAASPDNSIEGGYIQTARQLFQTRLCIQAAFSAADERLAADLYRSGVSRQDLENAILLGCTRKYMSAINTGVRAPIVSLRYFLGVLEEIREQRPSPEYWENVRRKLTNLENQWLELRAPGGTA